MKETKQLHSLVNENQPLVDDLVYYVTIKQDQGKEFYNIEYGTIVSIKPIDNSLSVFPMLSHQFECLNYFSNEKEKAYYPIPTKSKLIEFLMLASIPYPWITNNL